MLVCHVSQRFRPYIGGVETHVEEITKRLLKKGLNVEVLTTDPSGALKKTEIVNDVLVRRFRSFAPNEAYFLSPQLERYLRKHSQSYDVVHAHCYSAFPSYHAARTKSSNKFVFTPHYHGTGHTFLRNLFHVPYRCLGNQIFKKADRIICVSEYEKSLVLRRFNVEKKNVFVIPNGINANEIRRYKKRVKSSRTVLYVGRLEKYKGVHYLIEVLPRLSDDITLQIIGKGPYKGNLSRLAARLGLEDRVEFFHDLPQKELWQKYADADLFALLSNNEAYGISVAEALCSGVPCIVANTSALTEWVDGKNCFGIDYPVDVQKLSGLVMSTIGRTVEAPGLLDWDEVADRVLDVYRSILPLGGS
jgi:glycosyltransferase involved in cell wall biosynthesis